MSHKHFFDMLDQKIDPYMEFIKLKNMFEDNFYNLDNEVSFSLKEIIEEEYFYRLSFRGSYTSLDEIEEKLGFTLIDKESFNIDNLFCYCEYLYAMLCEVRSFLERFPNGVTIIDAIIQNINYIVEKTNHEWYFDSETFQNLIIEKNEIANVSMQLVKNDNLKVTVQKYLSYSYKGKLDKKRNLLNTLAREIEPILNSKFLKDNNFGYLESDIGTLLNKFHIRHNNKEGTKKVLYLDSLSDFELEEWYDKIYYLIISAIITNKTIEISKELKEIKEKINQR